MRNDMNECRISEIKKFIEEKTRELGCISDIIKIKEQEDDLYEVYVDGDLWSNYCSIEEVDTITAVLFKGIEIGNQMDWQRKNVNSVHLTFRDLNDEAKADVMDEAYKLITDEELEDINEEFAPDMDMINCAKCELAERKLYELNFVFNI